MVAVCQGNESDCKDILERLRPQVPLLLDAQREISGLYHVASYPTAVVVDADKRVRGYCSHAVVYSTP